MFLYNNQYFFSTCALVSVPISQKGFCCKRSQKQCWIIKTLLPQCLKSVCFLVLLLLHLLPHPLALVQKPSSPSSCLPLIPLVWYLLAFHFSKIRILKLFTPHLFFFFAMSTVSFRISLISSVVNPVKSCQHPDRVFSSRNLLFGVWWFPQLFLWL